MFPADHRGSHARAGADFSKGTAVHEEEPCQNRFLLKDCSLWRGPRESNRKELSQTDCNAHVLLCLVLPWTRGDREVGHTKYEVESEERGQQEGNVLFEFAFVSQCFNPF